MIGKFKRVYVVLSIMLIMISVFLTGCNIIEKLFINDLMPKRVVNKSNANKQNNNANKQNNNDLTKDSNPSKEVKINEGLKEAVEEKGNKKGTEKYKVTLFFANKVATDFLQEKRSISKVSGLAKETILALIDGPSINNSKAIATIPKGTKLLNIIIKEGICYVDFSSEIQKNHLGGSAGEYMTVNSIVKTLTQFSSIHKVQILIEGKIVPTLVGHLDISKPLENMQ